MISPLVRRSAEPQTRVCIGSAKLAYHTSDEVDGRKHGSLDEQSSRQQGIRNLAASAPESRTALTLVQSREVGTPNAHEHHET